MVNDAERVNEVEDLWGEEGRKLLGIALEERDPIALVEDLGSLLGHLDRLLGQLGNGDLGAGTGEVDRVRSNATADLEHLRSRPAVKLRKDWNVWLDEVLPRFDLVEVLAASDRLWRVADVARAPVPVGLNRLDRHFGELAHVVNPGLETARAGTVASSGNSSRAKPQSGPLKTSGERSLNIARIHSLN